MCDWDRHLLVPWDKTLRLSTWAMIDLLGMTMPELEEFVADEGLPRFRARQIHHWLYAGRARSFTSMTNLGLDLRDHLAAVARIGSLTLVDRQQSPDGAVKYLFRTADNLNIESVLIPSEARDDQNEPRRRTACLSTQVGCPLDCKFCATASMKLKRNLTAGEIVEQFIQIENDSGERLTNVVYMGMGEPMLNYDEVFRSVDLLTDPASDLVTPRHVTVSTSGLPAEIRRMADEGRRVKLALSLHALTNGLRSDLMPINRRYDLTEVLEAIEYYYRKTRLPVTYEYILFEGLNDSEADVRRLARTCRRVPSKVNVIPFHPIDFTNPTGISAQLKPTSLERFDSFIRSLQDHGAQVMVRSSSGKDIDAACGQLAVKHRA